MSYSPWENGASLPLDENNISVVAVHGVRSTSYRRRIEDAYANKEEFIISDALIKEGFTTPNRTAMYDLRGVGNASLNIARIPPSKYKEFLVYIFRNQIRLRVTFLPTVHHDRGDSADQYEGYVTKIAEVEGGIVRIEHPFLIVAGIESSVKSIFSKVYGNVPQENSGPQISTPGASTG